MHSEGYHTFQTVAEESTQTLSFESAALRALFGLTPDGLFVKDTHGRFMIVNQTESKFMGVSDPTELIGKTDYDFYPRETADTFREEERSVLNGEQLFTEEGPRYLPKLQTWILTTKVPVLGNDGHVAGIAGISRNVSDRERAEQRLRDSEKQYRLLVDLSPDGIAVESEDRLVFVNPSAMKLMGAETPDQVLGKRIMDFFHIESMQYIDDRQEEVMNATTPIHLGEWKLVRLDGSIMIVEAEGTGIRYSGKPSFQVVFRDITHRKKTEEQLKQSLREKELLISEVHHRVKNNLQVISSLMNLQAHQLQSGELQTAFRESQLRVHAMAMVHERLYHSENLSHIDFREYLESVTQEIFHLYGTPNVTSSVEAETIFVQIDTAVPCGLIVNELITNAFKHAFPDGRRGHVIVKFRRSDSGSLTLTVADSGIGPADDIDLESSTSMGFTIVRLLALQIAGSVTVERNPGCSFTIKFPG